MEQFEKLCNLISENNFLQKKYLLKNLHEIDTKTKVHAENYITHVISQGYSIEDLAEAYLKFTDMTNSEQLFFMREGHYRYSTIEQVSEIVYNNPDYMEWYMLGVGVSSFLWPQHSMIFTFFEKYLAKADVGNSYLEIGPGHGLFFLSAIASDKYKHYCGVDISATSLELTRSMVKSKFPDKTNYSLTRSNILKWNADTQYDCVVMGEVLEHVEKPRLLIEKIYQFTKQSVNPFVFISTCINAPEIDHIYNFDALSGIEELFTNEGFTVMERLEIPYAGKTLEECINKKYPISVAYVLTN